MWGNVKYFAQTCFELWYSSWAPGDELTVDETMIAYEGASGAHMSYIARKPHPLGF